MADIDLWFPVAIYTEENLFQKEQNKIWKDKSLEIRSNVDGTGKAWVGETYTTLDAYDITQDDVFKNLVVEVTSHVNKFAREHGDDGNYTCHEGWLNINDKGTFQEYHTHHNSIFSAIYYIASPEGSGSVQFEDPKEPDMLPLKSKTNRNSLSFSTVRYPCKEGCLLIFRSYVKHLVVPGTNETPRVSVALNFK